MRNAIILHFWNMEETYSHMVIGHREITIEDLIKFDYSNTHRVHGNSYYQDVMEEMEGVTIPLFG